MNAPVQTRDAELDGIPSPQGAKGFDASAKEDKAVELRVKAANFDFRGWNLHIYIVGPAEGVYRMGG